MNIQKSDISQGNLLPSKKYKDQLTPHQKEIFKNITSQLENIIKINMSWDNIISLSGAAGTGKTFLTTKIVKFLKEKEHLVTITAPTHKALGVLRENLKINDIDVPCKTLQSFLNIKLMTDYDQGTQKFVPDKSKKNKNKTDILIIDESSMVSNELYEFVQESIDEDRVKAVLFVGDEYQLLPIDSNQNKIFKLTHQYKLKHIVRQVQDSYIIRIASKLREVIKTKNYIDIQTFFKNNMDSEIQFFHNQDEFLNDFYKNKNWSDEDKVIASYTNKDVDSFNSIIRNRYWNQRGINNPNTFLEDDKLVFNETYSVNDVTIYHNSEEVKLSYTKKGFFTPLGIEYWDCKTTDEFRQQIFKIVDPKSISTFNDNLKKIATKAKNEKDYQKRKDMWKIFFELRNMFASTKYTFASTIHKLQGSTYETMYIDLFSLSNFKNIDNDTLYRLIYVAITRASKDIKILIPSFENRLN